MAELIIKIGGDSRQFRSELDKISKETKELEEQLTSIAKASGIAFAAFSATILGTTLRFAEFEDKFGNVVTLLDEGSFQTKTLAAGIEELKDGVLALGSESGESFEILNQGLFDLISAGVPAEKAISTLRDATRLATAGATDTATAVKALAATLTAFGDEAGTSAEISEKFFIAQKFGVTTVGELATEFNKVAGLGKALGLSFDEVLASATALTANGAKPTAEAMTELKATMNAVILVQSKLPAESDAVRDALSLQNVKSRGLVESLNRLKEATGGDVVEMQRLLGSAEALSAVLSLTGSQSELVSKIMTKMGDDTNRASTFFDAFTVKNETSAKAQARLFVSLDRLAIIIGEKFAPAISVAANIVAKFVNAVAENDQIVKFGVAVLTAGAVVTGLVTALALGTIGFIKFKAAVQASTIATKAMKLGIQGLIGATGIGLLIILITEVALNWNTVWPIMQATFTAFANNVSSLAVSLGEIILGALSFNASLIAKGWSNLTKDLAQITEDFQNERAMQEQEANAQIESGRQEHKENLKGIEEEAKSEEDIRREEDMTFRMEQTANFEQQLNNLRIEMRNVDLTAEQKVILDKEKAHLDSLKRRKEAELKHGKSLADAMEFFRSAEVKGTQEALSNLSTLTRSKNKQVFEIGKLAAKANAIVNIARGVTLALAQGGGIFGPFLAGTVIAAGAVQLATINAQKFQGAQEGALVTGGIPGRDSVPILATPGELITPERNFADAIEGPARRRAQELLGATDEADTAATPGSTEVDVRVELSLKDELVEFVEAGMIERIRNGTSLLPEGALS